MRNTKQISLSFTRPEYRILWNVQVLFTCAILASLLFMAWSTWYYFDIDHKINLETQSIAQLREAKSSFTTRMFQDGLTLSATEIEKIKNQIAFANLLNQKKKFSWATLLTELSETIPSHTTIQSVQVKFKDSTILLNGKAKDLETLHALITNLQKHQMFQHAKITSHRVENYQENPTLDQNSSPASLPTKTRSLVQFILSVSYQTDLEPNI